MTYNSFKTGTEGIHLLTSAIWKVADHLNRTDFSELNFGRNEQTTLRNEQAALPDRASTTTTTISTTISAAIPKPKDLSASD